jgi:hypothetical protein
MGGIMFKVNQRLFFGILSLLMMLFISGCDPFTPYGVRELHLSEKNSLVAGIPFWGPGGGPINFVSFDGGYTWRGNHYLGDIEGIRHKIDGDCNQLCSIKDSTNSSTRFRIIKGKTLYISNDQGVTWEEILAVPEWKNFQRNYILKIHSAYVPIDNGIRGPFDVIRDPFTGNILVAMGYEGMLLKTPDKAWEWIEIEGNKKIQTPSRLGMIGQIEIHLWIVALSIALFSGLICLRSIKNKKTKIWKIFIYSSILLILSAITDLSSPTTEGFYKLPPIFPNVICVLIGIIVFIVTFVHLKRENKNPFSVVFPKIIGFFIFSTGIVYILPMILWSQGIKINLPDAGLLGLGLSAIYLISQVLYIKIHIASKTQ